MRLMLVWMSLALWMSAATAGNVLRCPNPEATGAASGISHFEALDDGRVLVVGGFVEVNGQGHRGLALLDATGQAVAGAVPEFDGFVYDAERGTDGHMYIVGQFQRVGALNRQHVVRLVEAGDKWVVDTTWAPVLPDETTQALAVSLSATHAYIGFSTHDVAEVSLASGQVTRVLIPAQPFAALEDVGVSSDGLDLVMAGMSTGALGARPFQRIRLTTGLADPDWVVANGGSAYGTVVEADGPGYFLLGGLFSVPGMPAHENLARVATDGAAVDASFVAKTNGDPQGIERLDDGRVLVHGFFDQVGVQPVKSGVAILTAQGTATAWNQGVSGAAAPVRAATATSDGRIVVAEVRERSGPMRYLEATAGADVTPNPAPVLREWPRYVQHIAHSSEHITVSGTAFAHGQPTQGLLILDAAGRAIRLPTIGAQTDSFLASTPVTDGVVAVRKTSGGESLVRISLTTRALDTAWTPLPIGDVQQLLFDPVGNHVYVRGSFTISANGHTYTNLLRMHASGSGGIDTSWQPPANAVGPLALFEGFAYLEGGRIATSGDGAWDSSWPIDLLGAGISARAISVDRVGREIVWAGTNLAGNVLRIARAPMAPQPVVTVYSHDDLGAVQLHDIEVDDSQAVYVASPTVVDGEWSFLTRYRDGGATRDTTWDAAPTGEVFALDSVRGRLLAGGGFNSAGGLARSSVVAYGTADMIHRDDFGDACGSVD